MVKSCCVKGCTSNKKKSPQRKYFVFPTDKQRREKWKAAVNRGVRKSDGSVDRNKLWSPRSVHNYVCSAHFITGRKSNDQSHPDYVPSIFPDISRAKTNTSLSKSTVKVDRYERATKRARLTPVVETSKARKQLVLPESSQPLTRWSSPDKLSPLETEEDVRLDDSFTAIEEIEPDISEACQNDSIELQMAPMKQPVDSSEREMLYEEIENLRRERDEALKKAASTEEMLSSSSLSAASVANNNSACQMLTGIKWDVFETLCEKLEKFAECQTNKNSIPVKEQIFLTLVKLRHSMSFEFLAKVKCIPKTTVIDYFWKWIDIMHAKIGFMVHWPDRECVFQTIPALFKKKFPRVTSIIDCFEIFIEAPKNLKARAQCYSSYKKHCTVKVLIACTPLGSISFLSDAWGGRASDIKIVRESGFIDPKFHMPGDQILADRGFTLKDDFASLCSAELLTPAFTKGKKQLSAQEVEMSRKISSVRIHVERVIGLMKNRFNILKGTLPVRCVQSLKDESLKSTLSSCDKILTVCAALTNMGPGIVYKE